MIISHRGYKKQEQENTIAAFDAAFKAGADAIETDVRIAGDGNLVVSHDPIQKSINVIILDDLFSYIKEKNAYFFLEIKDPSPVLMAAIIKHIKRLNAWEKVHCIGFSKNIKTALSSQRYFPQLLVAQILMLPLWSYIKKPRKSNAVYIGWLDDVYLSEPVFKSMVSAEQLKKLKRYFEHLGFRVLGGVLNREDGIKLFQNAGINDIFTDEVETALLCHKQQPQF
jgi:glycerophosphoryl diester phosphodiesterase